MSKLDQASRRIIYELDRNSRTPYSKIAKATGIAQHTVRYRVLSLIRDGVIAKFNTVVNPSKLGYTQYKVLLRLHSADENTVQKIIRHLMRNPSVTWLVRFEGPWDIGITFKVIQMIEFSVFLDDLSSRFGQFISARRIDVNISAHYLARRYLVKGPASADLLRHYASGHEPCSLDPINREIISHLQKDSRTSASDIAEHLKTCESVRVPISREAVLMRIRQLENDRVITGYNMALNQETLGQLHYKVMLSLNHESSEGIEKVILDCHDMPRVRYVVKTLGDADYELDLEVESVEQYRQIINDLKARHPRTIRDHAAMIVTDCYVVGGTVLETLNGPGREAENPQD